MSFNLYGIQDPEGDNLGWCIYESLPDNSLSGKKIISTENDGFFKVILLGSCSDEMVTNIESAKLFWKKAISEIDNLKPLERQTEVYPSDMFIISYMNGYEIGGLRSSKKSLSVNQAIFWFKLGQKDRDEGRPPLFKPN